MPLSTPPVYNLPVSLKVHPHSCVLTRVLVQATHVICPCISTRTHVDTHLSFTGFYAHLSSPLFLTSLSRSPTRLNRYGGLTNTFCHSQLFVFRSKTVVPVVGCWKSSLLQSIWRPRFLLSPTIVGIGHLKDWEIHWPGF